jgi:D-glycero-alpha-D-manno-heptose-7-phosphate kinase
MKRRLLEKIRARAPLRLGLAGGGSDVSPFADVHGGAVLNATIDRYAVSTFVPNSGGGLRFVSTDLNLAEDLPLDARLDSSTGLRLHRGVYNRMIEQFNDGKPVPMTLTTHVESPMGSGLGSSSALVVSMVTLMADLLGAPLGEYEVASLAYDIERVDLGMAGGKQDQYAATFGGFNFLEFRGNKQVLVNPLRVDSGTVCELESSLILLFTGASRESAAIISHQSETVSAGGKSLEAMFQLKREATEMKEALLFGQIGDIAKVLRSGWEAKKATSDAVTTTEIDRLFELAMSAGALAGKVSGAGGGGFMMFLAEPERHASVVAALRQATGQYPTGARFTQSGSRTWRPKI